MNYHKKKDLKQKICRTLNVSILWLILGIEVGFAAETYSQKTVFSISITNQSVREVFDYIEHNSEFIFFYLNQTVELDRKVSLNLKEQRIENILDQIFENTDNTYTIKDRQIFITKRRPQTTSFVLEQVQKKFKVTGVITDGNGESIVGANVVEKGTTNGITSDIDGRYTLELSHEKAIISVSYIGYTTQEIKVDGRRNINIQLFEEPQALEQVVVTAYGTGQKKESVVGSIQTVRPGDLKVPATNLSTAFAGRLAGVVAVQQTGEPGADGANF